MKKILVLSLLMAFAVGAFADVFPNSETIVENFIENGKYIKVIKNQKNIIYFLRQTVSGISIDENDMKIFTIGAVDDEEAFDYSYSIKKWKIEQDDYGNIIITKK